MVYSENKMIWTAEKTWKDYHHSKSSFIYPRQGFVNNPHRGLKYVKDMIVPHLGGGEVVIGPEAIYQVHPVLSKIKDSSILVVGAGPTTNSIDWNPDEYDYIFSCNHFFLNDKVSQCKITAAFIGDEVDLQGDKFVSYLNQSETVVCFENIGRSSTDLSNFKQKNHDRTMWLHTRYHSKIGVVTRMISFLSLLDPKSISIIGMDGYVKDKDKEAYDHSFQPHKPKHGSLENNSDEDLIQEKYKQQYLEFWDYILHDVGKNIQFYNLGHGHPANMTTEVLTSVIGDTYQSYLSDTEARK